MKNSPSAVAGGLFFCVPEWGVSRPGGEYFICLRRGRFRASEREYLSFFVKRKVPKKTT